LSGDAGDDFLRAGSGHSTLEGGLGNDTIAIAPGALAYGGLGADLFLISFGPPPSGAFGGRAPVQHARIADFNPLEGDLFVIRDPSHTVVEQVLDALGQMTDELQITWNARPEKFAALAASAPLISGHSETQFDWQVVFPWIDSPFN